MLRFVSELLADERVFSWLQRGLSSSLIARRWVDRGLGWLWAGTNVASVDEVIRMREQLRELGHDLDALDQDLARLRSTIRGDRRG
ncbi:MAG: hypothetical protein U1E65_07820 [Myxococcota bacterium]